MQNYYLLNHKHSIRTASTQLRPKAGTHQYKTWTLTLSLPAFCSSSLLHDISYYLHSQTLRVTSEICQLMHCLATTKFYIIAQDVVMSVVNGNWKLSQPVSKDNHDSTWNYYTTLSRQSMYRPRFKPGSPEWNLNATLQYECITTYMTHEAAIFHNRHN